MTSPSASPRRACDRLFVRGTSALDLGLRTVAATAVGVPAALWALRADGRGELDRLAFYRELAAERDPALAFPAPRDRAEVTEEGEGRVRRLRFESPVEAGNPARRGEDGRPRGNPAPGGHRGRPAGGPRATLPAL